MTTPAEALAVVAFWRGAGEAAWFAKDAAFDAEFRERFLALHERAAAGVLESWAATAEGSLALLILLDQFPRNCFRGSARVYGCDPLARAVARAALAAGHDRQVEAALRVFFYLPFSHSEDAADQDLSVALNDPLGGENAASARGHQAIIARFGRFPHRNALLGRASTPEEQAFLDGGGFAG